MSLRPAPERSRKASTINGLRPSSDERFAGAGIVLGAAGKAVAAEPIGQRGQQRALAEPLGPFLQVVRQEAVAADGHDAGRRRGDADRAGRAVEPRGIAGIDIIERRLRRSGSRRTAAAAHRRRPGPSGRAGQRALRRQQDLAGDRGARQLARRAVRSGHDRRRRAVVAAAGAEQAGFAEQIDVGQRGLPAGQVGARRRPVPARARGRSRCAASASATARSASPSRKASGAGATSVSQACSLICCSSTSPSKG